MFLWIYLLFHFQESIKYVQPVLVTSKKAFCEISLFKSNLQKPRHLLNVISSLNSDILKWLTTVSEEKKEAFLKFVPWIVDGWMTFAYMY